MSDLERLAARVDALEKALTEIAETSKDNRTRQIARAALSGSSSPVTPLVRQHEDDGA